MVFALSQRQTTLWDQIRYSGSPEDFVWVLPVANAATLQIGLGDDNFVEALDAYSAPYVTASLPACFGSRARARNDGGGAFFGCGSGAFAPPPGSGSESTRVSREGETVVGPYAIAVISTKMGGARLDDWLQEHGYSIPAETRRAIDFYVDLQFDFVIMRLAPGAGVHQMQPVRVTTRGYLPVLPLRMIAAGIGDKVGLNLMVVSDSRAEAQGFDNIQLREADLTFNYTTMRSNWRSLFDATLLRAQGRAWIIESAQGIFENQFSYRVGWQSPRDGGMTVMMPPSDASLGPDVPEMGFDAMSPAQDAAPFFVDVAMFDSTASATDGAMGAMEIRDGGMMPAADPYVDRRYAFTGLNGRAVVTRMRTELGLADLTRDLIIQASSGGPIPVEYVAGGLLNAPQCPRGGAICSVVGGTTPAIAEVFVVVALVIRVRRRRRAREAARG